MPTAETAKKLQLRPDKVAHVMSGSAEDQTAGDLEISAIALTGIAQAASVFGPGGVIASIVLSIFSGAAGTWASRRSVRRMAAFLDQLSKDIDERFDDLDTRLEADEDLEDLAGRAARAAAGGATDTVARAIAEALSSVAFGAVAAEHIRAELVIAALDGLTRAELEGLQHLGDEQPGDARETSPSASGVISGGTTDGALSADAVVHRLVGRELLLIEPPGFGGFGLTLLGATVLDRVRSLDS